MKLHISEKTQTEIFDQAELVRAFLEFYANNIQYRDKLDDLSNSNLVKGLTLDKVFDFNKGVFELYTPEDTKISHRKNKEREAKRKQHEEREAANKTNKASKTGNE